MILNTNVKIMKKYKGITVTPVNIWVIVKFYQKLLEILLEIVNGMYFIHITLINYSYD